MNGKKRFVIVVFCLIGLALPFRLCAQHNFAGDFNLIEQKVFSEKVHIRKKPSFFFVSERKFLKYNPVSLALGGMMYFYQSVVSSQIAADCPYEVSCSNFSRRVIKDYGLIKGVALSADRLTRCTKMAAKDLHPLDFNDKDRIIDNPAEYKIER